MLLFTLFFSILDSNIECDEILKVSSVCCSNSSDSFLSTDFINFIPSSSELVSSSTLCICNATGFKMLFGKSSLKQLVKQLKY